MIDGDVPLDHEVLKISKAEPESKVPPDAHDYDLGLKMPSLENCWPVPWHLQQAYQATSTAFATLPEVKRVGTTNCSDSGNTCADYPVMSWFNSDASSMLANSEAGFVTIALNKSLAADGAGTFYGTMTSPSWDLAAIGTNLLQYSY